MMYVKITLDKVEDLVALALESSSETPIFYRTDEYGETLISAAVAGDCFSAILECYTPSVSFEEWRKREMTGKSCFPGRVEIAL